MIPKNCTECEYYRSCFNAYYGSLNCKHRDDIIKAARDKEKKNGRN